MRVSKYIGLLLLLGLLSNSCIERFYLDEVEDDQTKLVIEAHLDNYDSVQTIVLSRTVSIEKPVFNPVSSCDVSVLSENGDIYQFYETAEKPGYYRYYFSDNDFKENTQYTLRINTPEGNVYESDSEPLLPCPEVDSIEYEISYIPTYDPEVNIEGVQFYVDLNASENFTRYYRYELFESWEYHSTWPIRDYIDENNVYHDQIVDYSKFICYKTARVDQLFVLSTKGFSSNKYKRFKIHFVDNTTDKLFYRYSLFVKQFAITETAYNYWNALVKNQQESGGLFETQPLNVPGNVKCISDSARKTIGFFSISGVKVKRIYIYEVPGLNFDITKCGIIKIDGPLPMDPRPLYFVTGAGSSGEVIHGYSNPECFDCTLLGGTTELPDIWRETDE